MSGHRRDGSLCEGSFDSQSLSGRLDWTERVANPYPRDILGVSNTRAKRVGTERLLKSQRTKAIPEWSMAAHSKAPKVGVKAVFAGCIDAYYLNSLHEFWPIRAQAAMKRLFMDSDGRPGSFVSHPCGCPLNRSFGTFASIARATRLRTVDRARNRMSAVNSPWIGGGRRLVSPAPANEVARCEPFTTERNAPQVEDTSTVTSVDEVLRSRQEGCPFPPRPDATRTPSSGASRGTHGFVAPTADPWGSPAKAMWCTTRKSDALAQRFARRTGAG
jgi:hypothetical protein